MIDMSLIRKVEDALSRAICSAVSSHEPQESGHLDCASCLRKISKEAAQRLFFELDGKELLDLGMSKLAAERQGAIPRREDEAGKLTYR